MDEETAHNLGFGLKATWEASEDTLTIYDTKTYPPKSMITLSSDQMHELAMYWHDGHYPVCFAEIPMNDVICNDCLEQAATAHL